MKGQASGAGRSDASGLARCAPQRGEDSLRRSPYRLDGAVLLAGLENTTSEPNRTWLIDRYVEGLSHKSCTSDGEVKPTRHLQPFPPTTATHATW